MSKVSRKSFFVLALIFLLSASVRAEKTSEIQIERIKQAHTKRLQALGLKPEDLTAISIGKSHIDAAWLWHWYQTRDDKCPRTFSKAIEHSLQYPGFSYTQSSGQYYEWVQEVDPELFKKIQEAEKDGRWHIVGGMWIEPDGNMPEGESFVRQFLYGQRFFLTHFGKIAQTAWMEDSFGYNWNLPQIALKSGAKYMYTAKPTWNGHNIFPFHIFNWQSPDGSQVLTFVSQTVGGNNYFPYNELAPMRYPDYFLSELTKVDGNSREARFRETRLLLKPGTKLIASYHTSPAEIKSVLSNELMPVVGVFYGVGDGGHGPLPGEIENQLALQKLGYTKIGTVEQLFQLLEKYSERIATWKDEIYFEYHQGVFTTHEWIKRANRKAEALLRTVEASASIAHLFGADYPLAQLTKIWKIVLLNQFHDILPGSSIREVYEDAEKHHKEVQQDANQLLNSTLNYISQKINTQPAESGLEPIIVFNPLGWQRSDVVRYEVKADTSYQVFDERGKEIPSQLAYAEMGYKSDSTCSNAIVCESSGVPYLYFKPDALPALGWKTFYVKSSQECKIPGPVVRESPEKIEIENNLIKVSINRRTGLLSSLYDKRLNKEMLGAESNKIVAYQDRPREYPAWNLAEDYLTKPIPVPEPSLVKVVDKGAVFVRVLVERKGNPTSFKQWITVSIDSPLVELITWSDMHWKNSITKIEYNTIVETDKVSAEIPYAVIERSTHPTIPWDQARTEMPMEKWADLSNKDFGVALINFGKYAFSLTDDRKGFRVSVIKNAIYPNAAMEAYDVNPITKLIPEKETDPGEHWAHLAILSHPGDWKSAKVYKSAYEYNTPAVVYRTSSHNGALPKEASLFSLESESAYIAQIKKAEDDGDIVVRIVEGEGRDTSATLKVNPMFKIKSAVETDLLELNPKPLNAGEGSLSIPVGHFEIKTIKLGLKSK